MNYFFKVEEIVVQVVFNDDSIKSSLDLDFHMLACQPAQSDIIIEIINKRGLSLDSFDTVNRLKVKGDVFYQYFRAFQRHFGATYQVKEEKVFICLYIPYGHGNLLKRFLSPFFEYPLQSCLTDFFHNTFLAVLQALMMKRNNSLFHCSSFRLEKSNKEVVLAGGAQCGKSTFMAEIGKLQTIKICSEDFAFLTSKGAIYGYPHQTRVTFKDMSSIGVNYGINNTLLISFLDKINSKIYSILTKRSNGRHFSLEELFTDKQFLNKLGSCEKVFYVRRDVVQPYEIEIAPEIFCQLQTKIIIEELSNMVDAIEILSFLYHQSNDCIKDYLYERIYSIYLSAFSCVYTVEIGIPFYPQKTQAIDIIRKIIINNL